MDNKDETNSNANITSQTTEINLNDSFKSVQSLLQNMLDKFQAMSEEIEHRIDEMGSRINDLEQNINDLMQQTDQMENYEISSTSDQQNTIGQSKDGKELSNDTNNDG